MSSDELKVPSQRAEEHADQNADERPDERADVTEARSQSDQPGGDRADEEKLARSEQATTPVAGQVDDENDDEERAQSPRTDDEYAAAVPGAVATPVPGDEDVPYRDPYARTGGDMLSEPEPEPEPVTGPDQAHAAEHAAPEDVVLFDQDPAQVQARWRDLQASFVDDPGDAVQRADGLVGEVVESLTSSLTNRTNALRDRWKDTASSDTEQLRLALRDYRNVLERLLVLSGTQGTQPDQASGRQSEGSR
ncbi:hypothetical protein OHA25_45000 [Nonomuraea sp. NBC_00507]|uniref:hypothetical protein n=1 Tax=Nonomuraea sp. NBC_00507 TaxID=2976002 RepID=UPI002E176001